MGPQAQLALPRLTPAVRAMLIGIVVLFVVQMLEQQWKGIGFFQATLALEPRLVIKNYQAWRLLTWRHLTCVFRCAFARFLSR